jgi:hypothetical protein
MDDKLVRLREVGFTCIGCWKLVEERLECTLDNLGDARNVLYAFAVDGELKYVGKTVRALKARMYGYVNPGATQSTNVKNNEQLRKCLRQQRTVETYILADNGLLHFGGFHLNVAAALEDSIIRDLEPPWNGGQEEGPAELLQPVEPPTTDEFRAALLGMLDHASGSKEDFLDVNAGQLHRRVGGYPGSDHRMPICCDVMRTTTRDGDSIVDGPPKGVGASLTVRYLLPRSRSAQ